MLVKNYQIKNIVNDSYEGFKYTRNMKVSFIIQNQKYLNKYGAKYAKCHAMENKVSMVHDLNIQGI